MTRLSWGKHELRCSRGVTRAGGEAHVGGHLRHCWAPTTTLTLCCTTPAYLRSRWGYAVPVRNRGALRMGLVNSCGALRVGLVNSCGAPNFNTEMLCVKFYALHVDDLLRGGTCDSCGTSNVNREILCEVRFLGMRLQPTFGETMENWVHQGTQNASDGGIYQLIKLCCECSRPIC